MKFDRVLDGGAQAPGRTPGDHPRPGPRGDAAGAGGRGRRTAAGPGLLPHRQRRLRRQQRQLRADHAGEAPRAQGSATGWSSASRASPASSTASRSTTPRCCDALDSLRRRRGGTERLLAYQVERRWRDLDSAAVNLYLSGLHEELTAKDFRTWHATVLAAAALAALRRARRHQGVPAPRGRRPPCRRWPTTSATPRPSRRTPTSTRGSSTSTRAAPPSTPRSSPGTAPPPTRQRALEKAVLDLLS